MRCTDCQTISHVNKQSLSPTSYTMSRDNFRPDNGNGLFWYSHDYGNVHFTWISTEHNFTFGSPMYTWLENDLASVDRSRTPWLLVMAHRPMYCSGIQKHDDNAYEIRKLNYSFLTSLYRRVQVGQRDAYEDLLHKYNVDLFITGHYHLCKRMMTSKLNSSLSVCVCR